MIDSQLEMASGTVMSAGMTLRSLRLSKGMDVAVLASILKVPPQRILDLEADRLDQLPDVSFVRGLATSICRVLKVDAAPVLAALPKGHAQQVLEELQVVTSQRPGWREDAAGARRARIQGRWLLLVALVLLLALAVGIWGREDLSGWGAATSDAPQPRTAPPASTSQVSDSASANAPLAPSSPASGAVSPLAETSSTEALNVGSGLATVTLAVTEPSWVELRSADNSVVHAGTLTSGQSVSFRVSEPAKLTVGNARATQVSWRGQPLDLVPHTRDNVARLSWPQP